MATRTERDDESATGVGPRARAAGQDPWAIDKVTHDIEHGFAMHTAIAAVMELVNDAYRLKDALYGDGRARPRCASPRRPPHP